MVSYSELAVGDPLAYVFEKLNLKWMSGIIAVSAVVAMASVLLVFQMGQPRIWMSMSRDGLLPKKFAKVHPKYKTPSFSTIVVGFVVAIPALFMNLTMVTDLCSIGTLFAFVLVCGGVLVLQNKTDIPRGKFKTPYINGKFVMPLLLVTSMFILFGGYKQETLDFITNKQELKSNEDLLLSLNSEQTSSLKKHVMSKDKKGFEEVGKDLDTYYAEVDGEVMKADVLAVGLPDKMAYNSGFTHFAHKIPTWIFLLFTVFITIVTIRKNLSLIPLLGLLSCLYMMSQVELRNWIAFVIWLGVGLVIYFAYSRRHSKLNAAR
jgi:amino acid transporter